MKNKIIGWFLYPMKLILRGKVKRYKEELAEHNKYCEEHPLNNRRCGRTMTNLYESERRLIKSITLESFIEKWEITK